MFLTLPSYLGESYHSRSQKARVITEAWGAENFFCPNCPSDSLAPTPKGYQAIDYICPRCQLPFQLKSKEAPIGEKVLDGAFAAMMRAIMEDRTPNLFLLHYDRFLWDVRNVILIPHFAFSPSAIDKRKPLEPTARRAGWIGCFINLRNIPREARIPLVKESLITPQKEVRRRFKRLKTLKSVTATERGWTLDVLRVVQSLGKPEFTNQDVYQFASELGDLHPENRHVRDKIRQQLQFLRDRKFLSQVSRGHWALR
jgi:type II restriction enzyme